MRRFRVAILLVAVGLLVVGCGGSSAIDQQTKAALNTLKKNPKDPTALLAAAQGYHNAAVNTFFKMSSPSSAARNKAIQTNDLTKALGYYGRYLALPDSALGTAATRLRFNALRSEAEIYRKFDDYTSAAAAYVKMLKLEPHTPLYELGITSSNPVALQSPYYTSGAVAIFKDMLKLQPHNTVLYLQLAYLDEVVGDSAGAIAAYETDLKLEPHSQYAARVKAAVAKLKAATTAVYRNSQLGLAFKYDPAALSIDDGSASTFMTWLKTYVLPYAGKGTINARIGGLVVLYPKGWSVSQGEPGAFAVMWREPALLSRAQFARFSTARELRKVAAVMQSTLQSTNGPDATAVATHVGGLPAITETIPTTVPATEAAILIRRFSLDTPTSQYSFFGWIPRNSESTYRRLFDQIMSSLTVSK